VSRVIDSPVGPITLTSDGDALTGLYLRADHVDASPSPLLDKVERQLLEYFAGQRTDFDIAIALKGTPFQRDVWEALCRIPYGETWTYAKLAVEVGRAGAARAAGSANGSNPISIIVPCHRVIGSNGSLTGYGGGLPNKAFLLGLEQRVSGARPGSG
jgi:methylated-DNA-[protein]-cysteine S-methyltransferase